MFFVVLRRTGPRWDASRPMEEQSDWPAHRDFMNRLVADGFVVLGGPLSLPGRQQRAQVVDRVGLPALLSGR